MKKFLIVYFCLSFFPLTFADCLSVTSASFNGTSVTVFSSKALSNVVVKFCDGSVQKFDNLSLQSQTFSLSDLVAGVWVKSGCNDSVDGPGYGEFHDNSSVCEVTPTPTVPPTATPTFTPTNTPTPTPENTPTPTPENTPTPTPENTPTPTPENTPTPTPENTPTPTPENTPTVVVEDGCIPEPIYTDIDRKKILKKAKKLLKKTKKYGKIARSCGSREADDVVVSATKLFRKYKKLVDKLVTEVYLCPGECVQTTNSKILRKLKRLTKKLYVKHAAEVQYLARKYCKNQEESNGETEQDFQDLEDTLNDCKSDVCH